MPALVEDLRFRGLIHQMTDPVVEDRLDGGGLTVYAGFDPTADSLHVGHLLQMCTLRRLQHAGHRPIVLAGGGTGFVGDPGGKSEERTLLTAEALRANTEAIRPQLEAFVDFGGDDATGALLVDNADWLGDLRLLDFLRETGKHFTVNQMVAKDAVRSRLSAADRSISFTEFSYMLLQALDFLHLFDAFGCRLQLGGSDQWGNITMGVDLVRRLRHEEVWGLTTPLVLKSDGSKLGKTESGTVWLDPVRTSPYQLYQFFLRSEDAVVGTYLRYFTDLSHPAIAELDHATESRPEQREAQRALARQVCTLVHGADSTSQAERTTAALFGGDLSLLDEQSILDAFSDAPSTVLPRHRLDGSGTPLVDLLVDTGLAGSRSQARRTLEQGGAYINDRPADGPERRIGHRDLLSDRYVVLRRGKKDYHLVRFS
ncbi:MAG: tyrosine--tRNA ligase [Acidimicrobiales bacterium]